MCNKTTLQKLKPKSMIKKQTPISLKPPRKNRTRTRKHKFLSLLRLDSSSENPINRGAGNMTQHHHQLNLFPLHPEYINEDRDLHDQNMAYLFSGSDTTDTTLTGLLTSEEDSVSHSLTYAYGGHDNENGGVSLVRTALRNRERDASEEIKWVCYSEVVKEKVDEEVSSCIAGARDTVRTRQSLSLKLDYQEIMKAWSDKGPLYVEGECPQTVPDFHDDIFFRHDCNVNVLMDGLWRVPENNNVVSLEEGVNEEWKIGHREASVMRYKEKRQNRLFSKRIRYEVRKLNAEKRPRMKGRFVKRS